MCEPRAFLHVALEDHAVLVLFLFLLPHVSFNGDPRYRVEGHELGEELARLALLAKEQHQSSECGMWCPGNSQTSAAY